MIYFYYGTDAFRIKEELDAEIFRIASSSGASDGMLFRIRPDDEDPERVFEYLGAQGLFVQKKIVSVENIGAFRKPFSEALLEYIEAKHLAAVPDVSLYITHIVSEKSKGTAKDIFITSLSQKPAHAKAYQVLMGTELAGWVKERALARGVVLDRDIAAQLTLAHGNDVASIAQEIEKLALYLNAAPQAPIKADVRMMADIGWERIAQDGFKLIDAMGRKDHAEMLRILLRLFTSGEDPVKLLGLLSYALRAMLAVKDAQARPVRPESVPAALGLQPWQVQQYRAASSRYSLGELKRCYERLLMVDYKMKTGEGNPRMLLERFLLSV